MVYKFPVYSDIYLKVLNKGNPIAFKEFLSKHPEREILKGRIRKIEDANILGGP